MFDHVTFILFLTILATSVMAASAAIQAVRYEFDYFGAVFLSVITAVGGGSLRDVLIGISPVFWLEDQIYLLTSIPVGILTFFLTKKIDFGTGSKLKLLSLFDAVGLALFTLIGVKIAQNHDLSILVSIILGCITGIGGGLLRDVLCGETPIVLKKDIYATLSIIGGALYLGLSAYLKDEFSIIIAFLFIALTRAYFVLYWPVEMPKKK